MMVRGLLLATGLVFSTSLAEGAEPHGTLKLHPVEASMVTYTNAERARHGLPPLVIDAGLVQSARSHAAWMTNTRTLRHTSAPVGENIAMGQMTSSEAVQDWMNSSGHRANMLNRGYRRIGAAAYTSSNGRRFWCLQFLR